jgi:hypothetical protein
VSTSRRSAGSRWDRHPADLIFYDSRPQALPPEALRAEHPTFAALPAAQADQTAPWNAETVLSPLGFAEALEAMTDAVNGARTDVVT